MSRAPLRRWRGSFTARIFAGYALMLLALAAPLNVGRDGASMLAVAESLRQHGSFAIGCVDGVPGAGGECFSNFYLLQSLVLVPFVALGEAIGDVVGLRPIYGGRAVAMALPALCTAGAATLCAVLARERGASIRAATAAGAAFAFGTAALTYSRTLFAEPLGALCVMIAVYGMAGTSAARRRLGVAGIALTVLTKPQLVLVGLAIGLALALHERRPRPLVGAVAGTAMGTAVVFAYNAHRFGSPTAFGPARTLHLTGHGGADSGLLAVPDKVLTGAAALIVSPNEGLLLFAPVALLGTLALARTRPLDRTAAAALGAVAGGFAFYSLQPDGGAWGGRYLVPLLPLACVGLATLRGRARRLAVLLAVLTAISQVPTTVANFERAYPTARGGAHDPGGGRRPRPWEWSSPQLIMVWPAAVAQIRDARRTDPRALAAQADPGRPAKRLLKTVALWWWLLPVAGVPWWIGLVAAIAAIAVGARLLLRTAVGQRDAAPTGTDAASR